MSAGPETAVSTDKISVLKLSVFKVLLLHDLTSFVIFPDFLRRNVKEIIKWSIEFISYAKLPNVHVPVGDEQV